MYDKHLLIVTSSNFPYGSASANLLRLMGQGLGLNGWQVNVFVQRGLHVDDRKGMPPRCGSVDGLSYRFCGWRIRPRNLLLKPIDTLLGNIAALAGILSRKVKGKADVVLVYNNSGFENAAFQIYISRLAHEGRGQRCVVLSFEPVGPGRELVEAGAA